MTSDLSRLKRRADFVRAARAGRKWVAPGLIVQMLRRGEADALVVPTDAVRVGFTTSRKVGKAVARNRARRRLREAARQVLPEQAVAGCDYVIIGRAETLTRPFSALLEDLATAIRRLQVDPSASSSRASRGRRRPAAPSPSPSSSS
ncbi:MAG: ribonuclease P protein component [Rhodospirillales bacterium]|nr:ribonuclease P protein component [Rhodospirillales bacterium]